MYSIARPVPGVSNPTPSVLDTSRSISSSSRQWTPKELEFDQALREGPTAALDSFRTLFNNRETGPLTSDQHEIVLLCNIMAEHLETLHDMNGELWRALIESEFVLFLINVIAGPDFFDHSPGFALSICRSVMVIMSTWGQELYKPVNASDRATHLRIPGGLNDELWTSIEIMWLSLWDRRSSLARISTLRSWGPVSIAFDMIAWATMELRKWIYPHTNSNPVMVRVAYFVWVYVHGYERLTERDVARIPAHHFAPTLLYDHCEFLRKTNDGNSAISESQMFMEELLKSLDHRTLIRAAHNTLKYSVKLVDEYLVAYLHVLAIQMKVIGLHWYSTPPFLEAFTRAAARQTTHSGDLRSGPGVRTQYEMKVYGAVLEHIQIMIPGLKTGSIPSASFPGHRFWDIMLGGLLPAYSADSLLRHEQGQCLCADHGALTEGLSTFLGHLLSLTNAFASEIHNGRLPRTVIDEVREAGMMPRMQVTGIWYDEIRSMRMVLRHNPTWATYLTALEAWSKLGDAFGMDEASQRDLEAAQRARQCSWRMCAFHMTPSEKPLLVCKGCKEARYCSAACQRSDWKQGGHRTECRRVK